VRTMIWRSALALFVAVLIVSCMKAVQQEPATSSSFYRTSLADLPTCDTSHNGNLAYVTDTEKFYHCDGFSWSIVDISGPPGLDGEDGADGDGLEVLDANGERVGDLAFFDVAGKRVGIHFDDDAIGTFDPHLGRFEAGICQNGYCSAAATATSGGVSFSPSETAQSTWTQSYCAFTTSNCTGTCWLSDLPIKHSLFQGNDNSFYRAQGTETATSGGITVRSIWRSNRTACTSNATGSGICCSNFVSTPTIASNTGVGVTTTYTLDGHPFDGPLYFE